MVSIRMLSASQLVTFLEYTRFCCGSKVESTYAPLYRMFSLLVATPKSAPFSARKSALTGMKQT